MYSIKFGYSDNIYTYVIIVSLLMNFYIKRWHFNDLMQKYM